MCLHFNVPINPVEMLSATWKAASRACGYLRNPESGITGMDSAMGKLRSLRMDIEEKIRSAELAGQMPIHQVRDWLAKVSDVDTKVSKLKDDRENGYANWRINRRVRKRMAEIDALLEHSGAFEIVAIRPAQPVVQEIPVVVQPEKLNMGSYLSQLQTYLQDDDDGSHIIGIWGMGGVGKTTLLKCLNNELHSSLESGQTPLEFGHVIWAVASKDYKIENLQRDVARWLGLPLYEDKAEQARVIYKFLKHRNYLLLLDDLWQPLDFTEVGFPHPLRTKTSGPKQKVVFTTRLEGVCGKMQARRILKLECLNEDEAWQLFQDKVGEKTLWAHAMIPQLAQRVAKECDGLPLALVVIGAAMSTKKTLMEWQNAIALLEKSRLYEIHDMEEDKILPKLKFSYDNLADEFKQKCFLLCCLWPEDYSIRKIDLIECWMGHGLVDERKFDNIIEAYDNGHALIGSLLAACLLEPGIDQDKEVKMHDVVRDLALWIVSNCGEKPNKFIVNSNANSSIHTQNEVERISLIDNNVKDTSSLPSNCSRLETLILGNSLFMSIPTGFFKGTPALAYLDLSSTDIFELPSEIGLLSNLRYLNLSGTFITSLPLQLSCLRQLRFLFLRYMSRGLIIPEGLIEKLEMLSVIDISHTNCKNWKEILRSQGFLKGVGIRLTTTESLQQLIQLSNVHIWNLELFYLEGIKGPLQLGSLTNRSSIQKLYIMYCKSLKVVSIDQTSQKDSLSRLEKLDLRDLPELKEIVFRGVVPAEMMRSLTMLTISDCGKLLNISWTMCLPSLEVLTMSHCQKMKQAIYEDSEGGTGEDENVVSAGESSNSFTSLKKIILHNLPSLRMFTNGLLAFPSLEILEVGKCPEMKTLPFGLEIIEKRLKLIYGDIRWWEELEMEEDVRDALLPHFYPLEKIDAERLKNEQILKRGPYVYAL